MSNTSLSTGTLTGESVYLNAIQLEQDMPHLVRWNSDIDYMRFLRMGLPELNTEKDLREWLSAEPNQHEMRPYAIRLRADRHLIGMCAFKDINWQSQSCKVWIGIGEPDMRGKGYGTDAMRVMLRFAFMEMNVQRVGLEVGAFNPAARASYEKVGFQVEGTIRRGMYREGRFWDMLMMGILREEWEAKHES